MARFVLIALFAAMATGMFVIKNKVIALENDLEQINAKIDALYHARRATYLSCADLIVDRDSEGAAERIAEAYIKLINN